MPTGHPLNEMFDVNQAANKRRGYNKVSCASDERSDGVPQDLFK